jgi:ammonia channel protein AmtB
MLDAFGVHAVGGILGGFLTGFFASAKICGYNGECLRTKMSE